MPININEIRVIATVSPGKGSSPPAAAGASNAADQEKWIKEAVEEVLRVLEEKEER